MKRKPAFKNLPTIQAKRFARLRRESQRRRTRAEAARPRKSGRV